MQKDNRNTQRDSRSTEDGNRYPEWVGSTRSDDVGVEPHNTRFVYADGTPFKDERRGAIQGDERMRAAVTKLGAERKAGRIGDGKQVRQPRGVRTPRERMHPEGRQRVENWIEDCRAAGCVGFNSVEEEEKEEEGEGNGSQGSGSSGSERFHSAKEHGGEERNDEGGGVEREGGGQTIDVRS